jgi:biopolymer transport protein ExbD/biopolymer transport protein TolR
MQMKRRPNLLISRIDVTAFAGIMLALLFLFMPSYGGFRAHRGMSVDLPQVSHPISMPHANREDAMIVVITRDDKVFFGPEQVIPDVLPVVIRERINQRINQGSEKKVYIKADARAKYGWVAEVLDGVRAAGIEKIGFLVEQRRVPSPNP